MNSYLSQKKKTSPQRSSRWSRQRIFNTIILAVVLIVIVVVTAYVFSNSASVVLPDYLNRCIPLQTTGSPSPYAYSSTPQLLITINGVNQTIPYNIGILGTCVRPLHTFQTFSNVYGTIHIDTDVDRTYTLGDFFQVWGSSYGPQFATFSQNQLFNIKTDSTHSIRMIVNNVTDTVDFQNLIFPRDASTLAKPFQVRIIYGPIP